MIVLFNRPKSFQNRSTRSDFIENCYPAEIRLNFEQNFRKISSRIIFSFKSDDISSQHPERFHRELSSCSNPMIFRASTPKDFIENDSFVDVRLNLEPDFRKISSRIALVYFLDKMSGDKEIFFHLYYDKYIFFDEIAMMSNTSALHVTQHESTACHPTCARL